MSIEECSRWVRERRRDGDRVGRTYGVFLLDVELEVHRARTSGCYAELGRNCLSVCVMDCRVNKIVAYAI